MTLEDRWDDCLTEKYITIALNEKEKVDLKQTYEGNIYVMQCQNGKEVYTDDPDKGVRDLDKSTEYLEAIQFFEEQLQVESDMEDINDEAKRME